METVAAALIAAVPATLAAVASWRGQRKTHAIVQGNGKGPIDKMQERALDKLDRIEDLLVDHITDKARHLN